MDAAVNNNNFIILYWLQADEVGRSNVLKLRHRKNPLYFFELPNSYDFEKWAGRVWYVLDLVNSRDSAVSSGGLPFCVKY